MIRWAPRLGTIRGTPVRVHWTFLIFFVILVWVPGITYGGGAAVQNVELVTGVLCSIIVHEIAHALTAQRRGLGVREICLYPFGGVTVYASPVPPGTDEILVALAGPMANGLLTAALLLAHGCDVPLPATPGEPGFSVLASLFWANAFLTVVNLVPVLPLDGGWILRSLLTPRLGYLKASHITGNLGQALGLVLLMTGALVNIWLGLAGLLIFLGAAAEVQQVQPLLVLQRQTVADLMNSHVIEVEPETPFGQLKDLVRHSPMPDLVVTSGERILGFIPAAKVLAMTQVQADAAVPATTLMMPLAPAIEDDTPLPRALEQLRDSAVSHAPVTGKNGHIRGIVSLEAIERAHSLFDALRRKRLS